MNTQQQNSRLTSLPVVMFLAGICCFLWGSATPAIKTGYRLFQIQSSDAMSIILFAGMRFLLAGFLVILFHSIQGRRWIMPQKGSGRAILELCLNQTVLQYYFFYTGRHSQRGTWSDHHRRKCFYFYFSCQPDLPV